jgi:hypothetical protein
MKQLLFALTFAALLCAQSPWDGTKGNITLAVTSTDGQDPLTTISATTTDGTVDALLVTVVYFPQPGKFGAKSAIEILHIQHGPINLQQRAFFRIGPNQIAAITVTELRFGDGQIFQAR